MEIEEAGGDEGAVNVAAVAIYHHLPEFIWAYHRHLCRVKVCFPKPA